jgi:serine/threonine protein kinase
MAEEVIGGYRLIRPMATGQMSQVWEVVEVSSGRHFAMKLLLPEKVNDSPARHFMAHEASVGKTLAHGNIIRIVATGKKGEQPYFVMEYFPAGTLRVRIQQKEMDFIRERGQDVLKQAATALAFMNAKGWVHRDVKPDNILINSSGEVRLIDFALAQRPPKGFFAKLFRRKGAIQGTRSYMSPEQIRGLVLDGRADVYSFAVTAFEMVVGKPPFRAATSQELLVKHLTEKPVSPASVNSEVTKEFGDLVVHMLAKKKEDRPRDFHEVLMTMRNLRVFKPSAQSPAAKKEES